MAGSRGLRNALAPRPPAAAGAHRRLASERAGASRVSVVGNFSKIRRKTGNIPRKQKPFRQQNREHSGNNRERSDKNSEHSEDNREHLDNSREHSGKQRQLKATDEEKTAFLVKVTASEGGQRALLVRA